jgi:hypothetical protein
MDLLEVTSNVERFTDLLVSSISVKVKTRAILEIVHSVFDRYLRLIDYEYRRRVNNCEISQVLPASSPDAVSKGSNDTSGCSQDTSDLLGSLYEVFLKCKGYLALCEGMLDKLESAMLKVFQYSYLDSEHDSMSEPLSAFAYVSFAIVKDYCAKRWPERMKRQVSTSTSVQSSSSSIRPGNVLLQSQHLSSSPSQLTKRQRALKGLNIISTITDAVDDSGDNQVDDRQDNEVSST